jgi:uncharacterized protein
MLKVFRGCIPWHAFFCIYIIDEVLIFGPRKICFGYYHQFVNFLFIIWNGTIGEGENGYIYYVTRNHVIDAFNDEKSLARYANDARGLQRVKDVTNNSEYVEDGKRVFIESTKDIPANSEIFVGYGPEYWQVIRYNIRLDEKEKARQEKEKQKKNGTATKAAKYLNGVSVKKSTVQKRKTASSK